MYSMLAICFAFALLLVALSPRFTATDSEDDDLIQSLGIVAGHETERDALATIPLDGDASGGQLNQEMRPRSLHTLEI